MVPPTPQEAVDEWVVKVGSESKVEALNDTRYIICCLSICYYYMITILFRYHFLFEEAGYLLNRNALAFVNVFPQSEYAVRGHSSSWDRSKPAGREYGASMRFLFINESLVEVVYRIGLRFLTGKSYCFSSFLLAPYLK